MLAFQPITIDDLQEINHYFQFQHYRTCDFTIGGMFMWADYFKYEYTIFDETLFIKGVSEINLKKTAFTVPIGKLHLSDSIFILNNYCVQHNIELMFSAVPEEIKEKLLTLDSFTSYPLDNWADYLYDAQRLATFTGKKYNKKRNHINRFVQTYPDFVYERINTSNLPEVIAFFSIYNSQQAKTNPIFLNEAAMTGYVLENYNRFNFIGACIKIKEDIIGFVIGEILLDTLYIHIEKADKNYDGIYEIINMRFVADIISEFPHVKYVNKEEDVGDEGLRKSKLSYHPTLILNKYNLTYHGKT
jgi:hypothetical protein